jgi:hypothetical protein
MAGRITDAEENRFVLSSRFRKRLLAPGIPVDRIVLVLEEVRRLLTGQPVCVCWFGSCHSFSFFLSTAGDQRREQDHACQDPPVSRKHPHIIVLDLTNGKARLYAFPMVLLHPFGISFPALLLLALLLP